MDKRCQILLYLEERHLLEDIRTDCLKFLDELREKSATKTIPWRCYIKIDVISLLNTFPDLGEMLLAEPLSWRKLCIDVLFACLQTTLNDCDTPIQPSQVNLVIRLTSLPKTLIRSNPHNFSGLVLFEGVLIAVSKPTMYVYHSVWNCPEDCDSSETVLQNTPKVPPKCGTCRSVMFENSALRRCGEQMTATLLVKNQTMPRKIIVTDELIAKMFLGSNYLVTGAALKKSFTVWSVEEVETLAIPTTMPINEDIMNLYKACNEVPWKFIFCLASSLGVNVCPLHCFMHLKISLLMSLSSVKSNVVTEAPILHVLAAGLDTSFAAKIMTEAAKLADRSTFLSSNTAVVTSLVASAGGICVLPLPFHTYSQKQTSNLLSIIESNQIDYENQRVRLKGAVWAQGMDFKKIVLYNVANVFGFVCRGDYGSHTDEIVDFLLQNSVDPQPNDASSALRELKNYLEAVAAWDVSLSGSTETLLRRYFLAARRVSQRGVSVCSMNALVAITITSARLCRRKMASTEDGVFAIWLHISGSPEPRVAPEEYLQTPANVKTFHKTMMQFRVWLAEFIGGEL